MQSTNNVACKKTRQWVSGRVCLVELHANYAVTPPQSVGEDFVISNHQHILQNYHLGKKTRSLWTPKLPHIVATRVYRCADAKVLLYPYCTCICKVITNVSCPACSFLKHPFTVYLLWLVIRLCSLSTVWLCSYPVKSWPQLCLLPSPTRSA